MKLKVAAMAVNVTRKAGKELRIRTHRSMVALEKSWISEAG
jgi:hypothetical protein